MKLTVDMVRSNLAYYMSVHTPLTKEEVEQQFNEWMLDLIDEIIEVRENDIIKELQANKHIWRERVVYDALVATIKGLQKNEKLVANPWYPSPYFTVIDEFDSDVFKVTATEWEKLNAELDKD
jgi:hypothetical protein